MKKALLFIFFMVFSFLFIQNVNAEAQCEFTAENSNLNDKYGSIILYFKKANSNYTLSKIGVYDKSGNLIEYDKKTNKKVKDVIANYFNGSKNCKNIPALSYTSEEGITSIPNVYEPNMDSNTIRYVSIDGEGWIPETLKINGVEYTPDMDCHYITKDQSRRLVIHELETKSGESTMCHIENIWTLENGVYTNIYSNSNKSQSYTLKGKELEPYVKNHVECMCPSNSLLQHQSTRVLETVNDYGKSIGFNYSKFTPDSNDIKSCKYVDETFDEYHEIKIVKGENGKYTVYLDESNIKDKKTEPYVGREDNNSLSLIEYYNKNNSCPLYIYERTMVNNYSGPDDQTGKETVTITKYSLIIDSCSDIDSEPLCKNNPYYACVWVDEGQYCNTDKSQYVKCGDIYDIPREVPKIISFAIYSLQILVPIILIITGVITLVKTISSSKEEDIKKAKSTLIRRIIAAALVFFVILIVKFIVSIFADSEVTNSKGVTEVGNFSECLNCFLNGEDDDCMNNVYYKTNIHGKYWCTYLNGSSDICPGESKSVATYTGDSNSSAEHSSSERSASGSESNGGSYSSGGSSFSESESNGGSHTSSGRSF